MITVCFESVFIAYFVWMSLTNLLFFVALTYAEGDMKTMVVVRVLFDFIMFLTLPLLLLMTSGVCEL